MEWDGASYHRHCDDHAVQGVGLPAALHDPGGLASPLALRPRGLWDPAEQYWGEPDEARHPLVAEIIAAGVRPEFEMEQVIPGIDEDDWDSDPVADAAELHRAGAAPVTSMGTPTTRAGNG